MITSALNPASPGKATLRRAVAGLVVLFAVVSADASDAGGRSITDTRVQLPSTGDVVRVLFLRDYNTRVVVLGTTMLGLAAGVIGTFMLLRKRALMGDALSHATLPGIALAFMVMAGGGGTGKHLPVLLAGAAISGVLGVLAILLIRSLTRLKEDAALGIVLSVFFGAGVALMGMIQQMNVGHAAGLESFIYGKTASMLARDAWLIAGAAAAVIAASALLFKEFSLLAFDQQYAAVQGWPVLAIDILMMAMVTLVTVIGLQAVGLILIIALLIIPPAAARFWTRRLRGLVMAAGTIGAMSGWLGASLSALVPRLPAGAIIVVVAAAVFLASMVLGPQRGLLRRTVERYRLARKLARQHLLRAFHEWGREHPDNPVLAAPDLMAIRSWSRPQLQAHLRAARRAELIRPAAGDGWRLTAEGAREAARIYRNYRLWELFLVQYADIAPSHVDRDADQVEHVLGSQMVAELEDLLRQQDAEGAGPRALAGKTGAEVKP